VVCALAVGATATRAQSITMPLTTKWGPAPAVLPPGAQAAVLAGDPMTSGTYTLRLLLPAGYLIPPHSHPAEENVTVVSGALHIGMGDKLDRSKSTTLHAGAFGAIPGGMNHFAWTTGKTVIQIHGTGPFTINYVNPADAPKPR
jgi:hypothetical protein